MLTLMDLHILLSCLLSMHLAGLGRVSCVEHDLLPSEAGVGSQKADTAQAIMDNESKPEILQKLNSLTGSIDVIRRNLLQEMQAEAATEGDQTLHLADDSTMDVPDLVRRSMVGMEKKNGSESADDHPDLASNVIESKLRNGEALSDAADTHKSTDESKLSDGELALEQQDSLKMETDQVVAQDLPEPIEIDIKMVVE